MLQLVAQAGEHGLKPKTMRLARAFLRDKSKEVVLYRSKLPGCKDTKYMWALAHHPLPDNSEVISHDPEEEVSTLIAAVKAGARTLGPDGFQPTDPSLLVGGAMGLSDSPPGSLFRRLSDGSTGTTYGSSLSPRSAGAGDLCPGNSRRRHVPYHELEKQFGVGVSKAAANLGICKTTLKRICRQHGIKQWPRRQIAKALSQMASQDTKSSRPAGTTTMVPAASAPAHVDTQTPRIGEPQVPMTLALREAQAPSAAELFSQSCRTARSPYDPFGPPSIRTLASASNGPGFNTSGRSVFGALPSRPTMTAAAAPSSHQPGLGSQASLGSRLLGTRTISDELNWHNSSSPQERHNMRLQSMQSMQPMQSMQSMQSMGSMQSMQPIQSMQPMQSMQPSSGPSMGSMQSLSLNGRQMTSGQAAAAPSSSNTPGSMSSLPWVHLPQLGMSCPVYLMLPGRGL